MQTSHFPTLARLLFAFACLAFAGTAQALLNEYYVTSTADDGFGSLRSAILEANSDNTESRIYFAPSSFSGPRQTITLSGTLQISDNDLITITAPAAGVEISGNGVNRVFEVVAGARVTMTGLTIRQGGAPLAGNGGGILNSGGLTLNGCTLHNNGAAAGGAIYSAGNLTGNTLTLINCTLSANAATVSGGAIHTQSGLTKIMSCTIADNTAPATGGAGVASVGTAATRTEVLNSIISGNVGPGATDVDYTDGAANSFVSVGFNLIGDGNATGAFTATGDVTGNANPGLDALAENGGPTRTRALLLGSPAYNAGGFIFSEVDQRGISRRLYAPTDRGAFEAAAAIPLTESLTVTTTADEDNHTTDARFGSGTSLREAISYANRDGVDSMIAFDPVVFAAPRKTITLGGVQLPTVVWDGKVTIPAPAAGLEISGNNLSRVLAAERQTPDAPRPDLTLVGLTIRNGNAGNARGGGLYNVGPLLLDSCTFRDNLSVEGGALATWGTATIRNCTFSGNTWLAIYNFGSGSIESSTFAGNNGGIRDEGPHGENITVSNSIIADNGGWDVLIRLDNNFDSQGYNLIGFGNAVNAFTKPGDVTGVSKPDLAPLAENGGRTPTRAPLPSSLALNTGQTDLTVDQRGIARPQGAADDRGAVESTIVPDPALVVTTTADVVNAGDGVTSLREAVARANSDGVASPITFSPTVFAAPRKRITLGGSALTLGGDGRLTIVAPAAGVEISGGNASRVFTIDAAADVTLTQLTIRDGESGGNGGAIFNAGALELNACTVTGSRGANGGALASNGDLTARTLVLRNTTLSGNSAFGGGAGLYNMGGLAVIDACTIAGNTAPSGAIGGVSSDGDANTRTEVRNSIVSGNGGATATDVGFTGGATNSFLSLQWLRVKVKSAPLREMAVKKGRVLLPLLPAPQRACTSAEVSARWWVNDGSFQHLAVVFTGTRLDVYLNGTLMAGKPFTQQGYAPTYFYQLGTGYSTGWPSAPTGWFNFTGLLDETAQPAFPARVHPRAVTRHLPRPRRLLHRRARWIDRLHPHTPIHLPDRLLPSLGSAVMMDGTQAEPPTPKQSNGGAAIIRTEGNRNQ